MANIFNKRFSSFCVLFMQGLISRSIHPQSAKKETLELRSRLAY